MNASLGRGDDGLRRHGGSENVTCLLDIKASLCSNDSTRTDSDAVVVRTTVAIRSTVAAAVGACGAGDSMAGLVLDDDTLEKGEWAWRWIGRRGWHAPAVKVGQLFFRRCGRLGLAHDRMILAMMVRRTMALAGWLHDIKMHGRLDWVPTLQVCLPSPELVRHFFLFQQRHSTALRKAGKKKEKEKEKK